MTPRSIYGACHAAGGMTRYEWVRDPKRLAFIFARYKFVAKMFEGYGAVIEVGCADGIGSRIVRQSVASLLAIDIDEESITEAEKNNCREWHIDFLAADLFSLNDARGYGGVFALDVFEHFAPADSDRFLSAMHALAPVCILGSPSLESQQYASTLSKEGHLNCLSQRDFRRKLLNHWDHVFMFGMNDEVVHTGFAPMVQYHFALCVRGPK